MLSQTLKKIPLRQLAPLNKEVSIDEPVEKTWNQLLEELKKVEMKTQVRVCKKARLMLQKFKMLMLQRSRKRGRFHNSIRNKFVHICMVFAS